jgi:hypothetical protein
MDIIPSRAENELNLNSNTLNVLILPQDSVVLEEIKLEDAKLSVEGYSAVTPFESRIVINSEDVLQGLMLTYDVDDLKTNGLTRRKCNDTDDSYKRRRFIYIRK